MGATNNPFIRKQMLFDIPHRHSVPIFNLARKHLTNSGRSCYGAHMGMPGDSGIASNQPIPARHVSRGGVELGDGLSLGLEGRCRPVANT